MIKQKESKYVPCFDVNIIKFIKHYISELIECE